jgi:hypothetical protein
MKRMSAGALIASTLLVISCGSDNTPEPIVPELPSNTAPTVNAGLDLSTYGNKTVVLTPEYADVDGTVESIAWLQASTDEISVALQVDETGNATFTVPDIYQDTSLNFQIEVTDNEGAVSTDNISVAAEPAEHSLALSIQGFGHSMKVTSQSLVSLAGVYSADHPLQSISVTNQNTSITTVAIIDDGWTADVSLLEGDNTLNITAVSADNTSINISTVVTYYPSIDFTTALQFDTSVLYVGDESTEVVVSIGSSSVNSPTLTLLNDADEDITVLLDNGTLPDEIEGDGIFTGKFDIAALVQGELCYRVKATTTEVEYASELACIWGANAYTEEQVNASVSVADLAKATVDEYLINSDDVSAAAESALAAIKALDNVAEASITPNGGLWWVDNSGILGMHHPNIDGSKSAGTLVRHSVASAPTQKASTAPRYYQSNKYNQVNSHIVPIYNINNNKLQEIANQNLNNVSTITENRIQSSRAVIVSPYINNPNTSSNFGQSDDYFSVWKSIENANSCKIEADTAFINDGQVDITLDSFKNFSEFGYIHFSTHGDNYYQGLLSLWQDAWGPNDFLQGSLSLVTLYTGIILPTDSNGDYIIDGYENDLQTKRLALGYGGSIVILPAFFEHYLTSLPNSLVSLSACRSMYNNSLANVFLAKGAGAVMGYDDYVLTNYAQNTTNTILTEMMDNDATFGEAVDVAKTTYGYSDGGTHNAFLLTAGAKDLKLPDGQFTNLDFEQGALGAWRKEGDGRILSQLGSTLPTGGSFTGIISTGLGYTTTSGSITQEACLVDSVTTLSFNWNFFSEEFLEYCGSQFDDSFSVALCDLNDPDNCVGFDTSVNELCEIGQLTAADISFDEGDVHRTGWLNQVVDISSLAGKKVSLNISASDVGDSIYDSAILIDDIIIE